MSQTPPGNSTTTFGVDGMTCGHCVHAVTTELQSLPGVTGVDVDLVVGGSSRVTVTSEAPVPDDAVSAAVTEAGYAVTPRRSLL
jgi:copper chaperone CopZ